MSCFGKLFRKKKKQGPDDQRNRALQKLENTQQMLEKQQEDIEREIEDCIIMARRNAMGNKRVALKALQDKKYLEKRLTRVDNILTTIEMQKDALENAPITAAVVDSLTNACNVLRKSNITLDARKVQSVMVDVSEQQFICDEISTAISKDIVPDTNQQELVEELEDLEADEFDKKFLHVPQIPSNSRQSYVDASSSSKKPMKTSNRTKSSAP